jgi:hypothetical protein
LARKQGPGLQCMWQHRCPPPQGGEVWGHSAHGSAGACLSREVGFGAAGLVAARGCKPCYLSCLGACMEGYPVCRVSTVALESTTGEVTNPQVGLSYPSLLLVIVDLSGSLVAEGPNFFFVEKCPAHSVRHGGPLGAMSETRESPRPVRKMSMAAPPGR